MKSVKMHTLEKLENEYWGAPNYPSHLVTTMHQIRTIPLNQLTTEHLRMAIGQRMSLQYLIPLAIDKLEENPLTEGNMYEGDLLFNILTRTPEEYWEQNKGTTISICDIAKQAEKRLSEKNELDKDEVDEDILTAVKTFLEIYQ